MDAASDLLPPSDTHRHLLSLKSSHWINQISFSEKRTLLKKSPTMSTASIFCDYQDFRREFVWYYSELSDTNRRADGIDDCGIYPTAETRTWLKKKNPGKINKRNDEIFIFEWMSTGSWKIVKRTWWIRAPMMHLTWRRLWPLNRGNPHRIIDIIEYLKQELCWKYPQLSFGCQWNSNHETMRVNSIELKLTAGLIGLPASDIISNCLHMPFYIEM